MDILIFGTIWFWLVLTGTLGLIIYFLESALYEHKDTGGGVKATFTLAVFIAAYYLFGSHDHIFNILNYIKTHTLTIAGLLGVYLVLGVVWAIVKWYFYLLNKREYLTDRLKNSIINDLDNYIPAAKENKSRIMSWMMYWPFSGIWTLINDPIRKAFQVVYRNIEIFFDKMSASIFAELKRKNAERLTLQRTQDEERRKGKENAIVGYPKK